MKHLLLTTIAVVLLVGCGTTQQGIVQSPEISIHDAAKAGNTVAIKQHLAAGTDVNLKDAKWGNTPLIHAAYHGKQEIIAYLVQQRADLNAQSDNGWTALHVAVGQEHVEVVEHLLKSGADTTIHNKLFGQGENQEKVSDTPLDIAINFDLVEIIDLLRKNGAKTSAELKAEGK